jgi:hypothetical protein
MSNIFCCYGGAMQVADINSDKGKQVIFTSDLSSIDPTKQIAVYRDGRVTLTTLCLLRRKICGVDKKKEMTKVFMFISNNIEILAEDEVTNILAYLLTIYKVDNTVGDVDGFIDCADSVFFYLSQTNCQNNKNDANINEFVAAACDADNWKLVNIVILLESCSDKLALDTVKKCLIAAFENKKGKVVRNILKNKYIRQKIISAKERFCGSKRVIDEDYVFWNKTYDLANNLTMDNINSILI